MGVGFQPQPLGFLSTPSARRATTIQAQPGMDEEFLSTPSARRATFRLPSCRYSAGNFYPRPPRGGRPDIYALIQSRLDISIHALREEGDTHVHINAAGKLQFLSTPSARRATRGGHPQGRQRAAFLSTPSARRATAASVLRAAPPPHFYPRPPRGGRPPKETKVSCQFYFYPRPPRGGRLRRRAKIPLCFVISIHALREEGDGAVVTLQIMMVKFLSTPSARRATARPTPGE